ncbi:MAG TPA: nodulation protein NfeD, partial [Terriglobales bacterium]|nr:nodulation protein NfeD [Terriglobales bacterium]
CPRRIFNGIMPGRRFWLTAAAATIALLSGGVTNAAAAGAQPTVVTASLDGEIDGATQSFLGQAIGRAESVHAAALVVLMNTPGGLSTSMDDMVTSLLNARVPTIVYVTPAGARADSAGLFVAQAADVVAMAPGTNIGSAHPIDSSGANIGGELETKIVNDAVARIRELATSHGRNADWCEQAVRQSVNVSDAQAVSLHVADLQANDVPSLLAAVDGRQLVRPHGGQTAFHVAGATVQDVPMPLQLRFLQLITDPNVAYVLLLLAIFGLLGEVTMPGAILPGVVGAISAVLALLAFSSLPINLAGALLVVLAFVLFVIDLKAPTHGVLTVGGIVSLVLGSAFLFNTGPIGGVALSPLLIIGAALACAGLFGFVLGKAIGARNRPAYDMTARAVRPADPEEMR